MVLNDEQQKLAEENHDLIYWFAKNNKLDIDEYYGELAIELCKAAYRYDETTGYSFTTYATKCMNNRIKRLFQKKGQTIEGNESILSLDYIYYTEWSEPCTLADLIVDNKEDIEKEEEVKIDAEYFVQTLNDRDKYIFKSLLLGKTQSELAEELEVSPQYVHMIVKRIRKKYCKRKTKEDEN